MPDSLPFLLAGNAVLGLRQAQMFLPLARPLYYLSPPGQPPAPEHAQPLIVGSQAQLGLLEQWMLYPGHAALAALAQGPDETSWHRVRQQLKGLNYPPAPEERASLLFLLQARLETAQSEQELVAAQYQWANTRLLASLDQKEPASDSWLKTIPEPAESCRRRLRIWAEAASSLSLPNAAWLMERPMLEAWGVSSEPSRSLPWPRLWRETDRRALAAIAANLDEFIPRAESLAAALEQGPEQLTVTLHCLPGAARQSLLHLSQPGPDFLCLAY